MKKPLRVMILEDHTPDQKLIKRQVRKYRKDSIFTIADDKTSFVEKLNWCLPDLILADFDIPGFSGLEALIHTKENKPFVPFVFISGGLKPGNKFTDILIRLANGYLSKDELPKLPLALQKIMSNVQQPLKAREEQIKRENCLRLQILKIASLVDQAEQFSKKEKVIALLDELIVDN